MSQDRECIIINLISLIWCALNLVPGLSLSRPWAVTLF